MLAFWENLDLTLTKYLLNFGRDEFKVLDLRQAHKKSKEIP